MKYIIHYSLLIYMWWRNKGVKHFMNNPLDVQEQQLQSLVEKAKNTAWGKDYNYSSIQNYSDFKKNVPLSDYESILPYTKRIMNGENDVLWPGKTKRFAKSSGTTSGRSKFIPAPLNNLKTCHLGGSTNMLAIIYHHKPSLSIYLGKSMAMGGSLKIGEIGDGIISGDVSALMMSNMIKVAYTLHTPSIDVALMEDWEKKLDIMARQVVKEDMRMLAGVPTWTLVLARKVLKLTGKKNLLEVWPNLEAYIHGGVNFSPYRDQFKKLIPSDDFLYVETYNSTEGFFSSQEPGRDDMLLQLNINIFYEFIPVRDYYAGEKNAIPLSDVKVGVQYAMVISTNAGLWRYINGDTVMFTTTSPYRLKVTGRIGHFINSVGEEVIIANTDTAIKIACEKFDASIIDYTVAPIYPKVDKPGAHEWLIEFDVEPIDLAKFNDVLDKELQKQNSDYEAKRVHDLALEKPHLLMLQQGTFEKWLKNNNRLGGQHKVPRLSNDRKVVEEIKKMI